MTNEISSIIVSDGFDAFCYKYHLRYCYHPELPLVVVTYDNRYQSKDEHVQMIMNACRGIVFETASWNVVSKSFDRFFRAPDTKSFTKIDAATVEVKEDGSLLNLFCYKGKWILASRNNFAHDLVYDQSMTYIELFENALGESVDQIGCKLNQKITYSFEVCSIHNRIVKKYEVPKVYLLGCFLGDDEIPIDQHIFQLFPKLNQIQSTELSSFCLIDVEKMLNERVLLDPLFEGFVIKILQPSDRDIFVYKRTKMKNPLYLLVHNLKYRSWKVVTQDVVDKVKTKYPQHLDTILEVFKYGRSCVDYKEYVHRFNGNSLTSPHSSHSPHLLEYCYLTQMNHDARDQFNNGMAKISPTFDKDKNSWTVHCYCGQPMKLTNLKMDLAIYKTCPVCDIKFDTLVYLVGNLIWICSDEMCNLTHQAHQKDFGTNVRRGQPTGIPCSRFCKDLRLSVHQMMNSKKISHKKLANILQIDESKAHISLFGVTDCVNTLEILLHKE